MTAPCNTIWTLIVLMSLTALAGCSDRGPEQVPGREKPDGIVTGKLMLLSPFRKTDRELFRIALSIKEPGARVGTNEADIILRDVHDEPLTGAAITPVPWMPGMGHGVGETPRVTDRGGGRYGAGNIVFNMEGYWEVRVRVIANGAEDTAVFHFPDVREQ